MPFGAAPRQLRGLAVVCLLAAAACMPSREESGGGAANDAPPPPTSPLITTDRESYRARRTADAIEVDIVTTFTNRTSDTVRLHPCGTSQPSFVLEKWIDGAWRPAYNQACPAILMLDPPSVAPSASRTDTARVRAMLAANAMPRFETEPIAGSYRVVYVQAYRSWRPNEGPGELLPLEQRVSNTFRIEE
jgi:hypothetical protein